jgi:hypothetical protein
MSAVPSSPELAAQVAQLAAILSGFISRPMDRIEQLLRLQHHATLQAIDPRPITMTVGSCQPVKVFDLDRYRCLTAECPDDEPEAA